LAGVGRHRLGRYAAALGTGEGGAEVGHPRRVKSMRKGVGDSTF
jgi:hypothetical protein